MMNAAIHAVVVDGDVSYPPTSGKRLRTLNLMLRLGRNHQVTYIGRSHGDVTEAEQAREYLEDHGIHTVIVHDPLPSKSGALFYLRLAGNLLSALPYSVATHTSMPMRRALEAHAATNQVDLWQFEWTPYLGALRDPNACKLLMAHNVDSLIWQRYHETAAGRLRRWYIRQQWRKFERFEKEALATATRVVAVSAEDATLIRDRFGQPRVDVVENGIDRDYFESVRGVRDPKTLLFLGALDWRPNLDAVDFLLTDIFPRLRQQATGAKLQIVGRRPPQGLLERVKQCAGVELHADVADVRPFLAQSGIMVVPLRIGGGSRLKILEALACGLPVVSTTVGAEGLELRSDEDIAIADSAAEMVDKLVAGIRAPEKYFALAAHARIGVLDKYDWDTLAGKLEAVWEKCLGNSACDFAPTSAEPQAAVRVS